MSEDHPYSQNNFKEKEFLSIKQIKERVALLKEYGFPESAKKFREKYKKILVLKRGDD